MSKEFQYDVFLSHNAKDKPRVRRLAERLRQAGLRVWFDEWNVRSGDIIALKVDEGLELSRVLLLCISPNALASGWVALERSTAIHRDPANADRRFIPLLLAECDLPDTLRRYKYVDFLDEREAEFAELLRACRIPTEEVSVGVLPKSVEVPRPSMTEKGRGKKPAEPSPTPPRKRTERKPQVKKPPEQTEPPAVLERKLTGHKGQVIGVAVSPDGKWVVSGSADATIKTWDLETGNCLATIELAKQKGYDASESTPRCVGITSDGNHVLVGSYSKVIPVLTAPFLAKTREVKCGFHHIHSIVPLLPGNRVVIGGDSLLIWDLDKNEIDVSFSGHKEPKTTWAVYSVAVSPDGLRGVSASSDNTVKVWDLRTGECLATMKGHSNSVKSVLISPEGRFAVSGSEDKTVKVWDLETGTCGGTLEGHQGKIGSVAISPDGTLLASTGFTDRTVRLWDWKTGVCLQVITDKGRDFMPTSVAFSPDSSRLVVGIGNRGGGICVYRIASVRPAPLVEATRRYVNAKVVLLGEGTVGKTSLAHRLIEDKYVIKDRTHGMNVWPLDLPLPPDAALEREALLWDLAGQEDYRLIHQLFLDETALALLLINPQKDDPFAEAGDWLKALKTAAGNHESKREAAQLAIFSQVDVGEPKLGKVKLDRFCQDHGLAEWLVTSAKNGRNCSDQKNGGNPSKLKQLITQNIPWDKLPWTSTPRLMAELKTAVMTMRDEREIRLLRFAELSQRLEQALPGEKFDESAVRTAVTLLANHGLARPLKFGDLVLLQPELLNGYAGAIIRAARAHTDEIGCVLEADIYWPGFDFTGVERLKHRPDEELLLRALVQTFLDHSLCIAEETPKGRQLVFPSQYRREKDLPRDPDIFVSYTFSGEWQTVWTTLVVRLWYSQEFQHRELWRNAAEFASGKGHTLGLKIDNQQGEGRATISMYFDKEVPDELKAIFIEYAHRHLAKYGCEVSRDRRYVCPSCGKAVKDLGAVRKRIDAKKDFITCQECDERVPLMDFIEQRLKSDPVAQKILAMDATAARELDTQALEQILIGHMMAITGEANQFFRLVPMSDHGIDGEVEFKDNDGKASGKCIYIQLKSSNSYLRTRMRDGSEVIDVKDERHLDYWVSQPVDVYLVIRQTDEASGGQTIRWMNVTAYLRARKDKQRRQIVFNGEKLDMEAVWKVRDQFFPPVRQIRK